MLDIFYKILSLMTILRELLNDYQESSEDN